MSMRKHFFTCALIALATIVCRPASTSAQFNNNPFATNFQFSDSTNSVDLDLVRILTCEFPDNPALQAVVCGLLLEDLLDQLVEAEAFLDQVFAGYRSDIPDFLRRRLVGPVRLQVVFEAIDGPGMVLARAGPNAVANLLPNPFLQQPGGFRAWSVPRTGTISLDVDDVVQLVLTELMVDVAVHEAFHAMGHPSSFLTSGLNGPVNDFGQINFIGDRAGVNGVGFGILEYREESGNPFAQFIPLSQEINSPGAHLSAFAQAFNRPDEGFQEVFLPTAPPPGVVGFMSRSLQGMFADLGYKVRGINAPGFVDIDQDGIEDEIIVVNPTLPGDPFP